MKNLATCKPSEFLKQTSKIRKSVANWLSATEVLDIRARKPELIRLTDTMSDEERAKAKEENGKRLREQMKENAMAILDAILDEHPDETLELLALLCFIDPEDVDNHPVSEYLGAFTELINNEDVVSFFISLARLENLDILKR